MSVTTTQTETLKSALNEANPNKLADAMAQIDLGDILTPLVTDTGAITASATVTLDPPALMVQAARVVTSGTAASVGSYLVSDASATTSIPPGGASSGAGVAKISADGTTITFPNTITRAVIQYIPLPATDLTDAFTRS